MRCFARWLVVVLLVLAPGAALHAEKVGDLPAPTSYVSDFAGVLDPAVKRSVEDKCAAVDRQANAQIAVVMIKTLDEDQSIEEFSTALEEKWKVGKKGTDRGLLLVYVTSTGKGRIEVGYGLEGILNDAKVGDIGRAMRPYTEKGDYNEAVQLGVNQLAAVIAADAGVTLTPVVHRYHREQPQKVQLSLGQMLAIGGVGLVILFILIRTGNVGLLFFLLGNIMGGGGGGGGGRDNDRGGGGFGGFGGGGSGGGGADF